MEERNTKNAANDNIKRQVDALADLPLTGEQAEDAKDELFPMRELKLADTASTSSPMSTD
jgi:hypothetical protein